MRLTKIAAIAIQSNLSENVTPFVTAAVRMINGPRKNTKAIFVRYTIILVVVVSISLDKYSITSLDKSFTPSAATDSLLVSLLDIGFCSYWPSGLLLSNYA